MTITLETPEERELWHRVYTAPSQWHAPGREGWLSAAAYADEAVEHYRERLPSGDAPQEPSLPPLDEESEAALDLLGPREASRPPGATCEACGHAQPAKGKCSAECRACAGDACHNPACRVEAKGPPVSPRTPHEDELLSVLDDAHEQVMVSPSGFATVAVVLTTVDGNHAVIHPRGVDPDALIAVSRPPGGAEPDDWSAREVAFIGELRRAYGTSMGEASDGSAFTCARCRRRTSAVDGGADPEGLCSTCWVDCQWWLDGEGAAPPSEPDPEPRATWAKSPLGWGPACWTGEDPEAAEPGVCVGRVVAGLGAVPEPVPPDAPGLWLLNGHSREVLLVGGELRAKHTSGEDLPVGMLHGWGGRCTRGATTLTGDAARGAELAVRYAGLVAAQDYRDALARIEELEALRDGGS